MAGKDFRTYSRTVAANGEETIDATGRYVACLSASDVFKLAVDDEPFAEFEAGLKVVMAEGETFSKVRLQNTTGGSITLKVIVGDGEFEDARVVLPSGGLKVDVGDTLTTATDDSVAATATEQVFAVNSARREAVVHNLSNTVTLRVGDVNAGAARGIPVAPGGTLFLETTAAVYVHNPDAAAVSVALAEIAD